MGDPDRPIVMVSFSASNRDPLTSALVDALSAHVTVRHFSWRGALLGRYDVLNVHWPDHLTKRHGLLSTVARRVMYLLLLLRLRWGRPVLVRTLHNINPHEGRHGSELALLRLTDRWTEMYVTMQPDPPITGSGQVRLIPQGHYRNVYDQLPTAPSVRGRLLFFGLVRGYKGVPGLIEAFARSEDEDATLRVVGREHDQQSGDDVRRAAAGDPRVSLALEWVSHETLALEVGQAELVVLPYTEIFNSGTVIVALSMDRPVLVPRHATTEALAREVGPGWVFTFDQPLTAADLEETLRSLRTNPPADRPDLSARDWHEVARGYAATYQEAIDAHRSHRRH
ncbi:glycosyltransferase [Solicola sp. PLA-1-18]|uniref:glycosyltransferase n=1 Tax=Solicola sp. PLA-1-18 TaxID=3380532 RepID=UPI003B77DF19